MSSICRKHAIEVDMIISFSCQNFRSIREKVTLDFQASPDKHQREYFVVEVPNTRHQVLKTAMIYGANASGKTNILLALEALRRIVISVSQNKDAQIPVQPHALESDRPSVFEIAFVQDGLLYEYYLELSERCIISETLYHYPRRSRALIFDRQLKAARSFEYSYKWTGSEFSKQQMVAMNLLLQNRTVISGVGSFQYSGPINAARDWFTKRLLPIVYPKTELFLHCMDHYLLIKDPSINRFFVDQLQKADLNIGEIRPSQHKIQLGQIPEPARSNMIKQGAVSLNATVVKDEVIARDLTIKHNTQGEAFELSYNDESMGTQRYFGIISLLLELLAGKIVLIDEVESSLHNDLVIHFISSFLKNSAAGQLIFTSHNSALRKEKEIIRRDCVWITDRKEEGSTELTRVSDYPVRKEHALDSLFKKGLIGGKPNLGSIEIEDLPNEQKN